jgi:CTP synthase (UTP-ammonia lyase)
MIVRYRDLRETLALLGCAQVVRIALVGKYTGLQVRVHDLLPDCIVTLCHVQDSYLSVLKALKHSAIQLNRKLEVVSTSSTPYTCFQVRSGLDRSVLPRTQNEGRR